MRHSTAIRGASLTFQNLYPNRNLPKCFLLKINGSPQKHDFGLNESFELIVSEKALNILKKGDLSNSKIELI